MEQVDMISTMRRLLSVTKQGFFTEQKGPGTTEIMRSFIILFICTYIYNDDDDMYIYMMMMVMMAMMMMVMMVTMMMMICTYIYI